MFERLGRWVCEEFGKKAVYNATEISVPAYREYQPPNSYLALFYLPLLLLAVFEWLMKGWGYISSPRPLNIIEALIMIWALLGILYFYLGISKSGKPNQAKKKLGRVTYSEIKNAQEHMEAA